MEPLAPFIKPRQEAIEIRRILTVFLAQNISNPHGELLSATSLFLPPEGAQVRRIPPQVTGIRRSYLKALQAHLASRECYNHVAKGAEKDTVKARRREQREIEKHDCLSAATSADLLREKRRHKKLTILRDSLHLLANKDAAKPDYLDIESISEKCTHPPEVPPSSTTGLLGIAETEAQAVILKLEKAVLRAHNAVENEKIQLAQAKETFHSNALPECVDARTLALHRTRDELINWLELRLASTALVDDSPEELPISSQAGSGVDINERVQYIQEKYNAYLDARKSLCAYMSYRAELGPKPPPGAQEGFALALPQPSKAAGNTTQDASLVLPYLSGHLIPTANTHVALLQHESHLSRSLINGEKETIKNLEILAEESNLLSKYQQSASNSPLRRELSPDSLHSKESCKSVKARTITQIRDWVTAASAERSSQEKTIETALQHGEEESDIASNILQRLQDMVGVEQHAHGAEEQTNKRGDYPRHKTLTKGEEQSRGVWAGFDGKLGIESKEMP